MNYVVIYMCVCMIFARLLNPREWQSLELHVHKGGEKIHVKIHNHFSQNNSNLDIHNMDNLVVLLGQLFDMF